MRAQSTYITIPASEITVIGRANASGELGSHDPDVLQIQFTLVYEGVNSNGDRFTADEMRSACGTLVHKRLNWEHDEPSIGVITKAWTLQSPGEPLAIACEAVLWWYNYPDYADIVVSAAEMGHMGMAENAKVGVSMEALFTDFDYVIGDFEQVIPREEDPDGVLAALRGKNLGGKLVSRLLKNVIFNGAGVVTSPAERKARLLAVASNKSSSDGEELFVNLEASDFALSSMRMFPIDTKEHTDASMAYFGSVAALIQDGVHEAQLSEAHKRILAAAERFGLPVSGHSCSLCESEGGIEDMTKDKELEVQAEVEEAEDLHTEAETENPDESPEAEAAEEVVEEPNAEESEAEAAEEFDLRSAFEEILRRLPVPEMPEAEAEAEAEAAEEGVEDPRDAELAQLRTRIDELTTENRELSTAALVRDRLDELAKAGVELSAEDMDSRKELLAKLDNEGFEAYKADLTSASRKPALKEETPLIGLEDEGAPSKRARYLDLIQHD